MEKKYQVLEHAESSKDVGNSLNQASGEACNASPPKHPSQRELATVLDANNRKKPAALSLCGPCY